MKMKNRITTQDYILAVKKADRAIALENSTGFRATTHVHKSKKAYNRKEGKKINFDPSFLFTVDITYKFYISKVFSEHKFIIFE